MQKLRNKGSKHRTDRFNINTRGSFLFCEEVSFSMVKWHRTAENVLIHTLGTTVLWITATRGKIFIMVPL